MAKVYCAEIMCRHNKDNLCCAKEINLSSGRKHTLYDGVCQVWTCRSFEMSAAANKLRGQLLAYFNSLADGHETREVIFDEHKY